MNQADQDRRIDYIEFGATEIDATKEFYSGAFGWEFTDYGPDYTSFNDGRLSGGFTTSGGIASDSVLVVLYATDLDATEKRVTSAGGKITKETYEFPGGRRFHFADPSGNELAVWSEK